MHTIEEYEDLWWSDNKAHQSVLKEYSKFLVSEQDAKADYKELRDDAYAQCRDQRGLGVGDANVKADIDSKVRRAYRRWGRNEALRKFAEAKLRFYSGRAMGARGWGKTREEEMKMT